MRNPSPPPLPLANRSLEAILRNVVTSTITTFTGVEKNLSYPEVASNVHVQESTSSLLFARAVAKAGYIDLAWQTLEALFSSQDADTGKLYKYRYADTTATNTSYFLPHTSVPGPRLGEGLRALPIHASIVLEVFGLSRQTKKDVLLLQQLYSQIYNYHQYWVTSSSVRSHPWESLLSPLSWATILDDVKEEMNWENWTLPFDVPQEVKASYWYHPDVFPATIYLLLEESVVRVQPVELASIWYQSNLDLLKMNEILLGRHQRNVEHITVIQDWLNDADRHLQDELWDEESGRFAPRLWNNTTRLWEPLSISASDASQLTALWSAQDNVTRLTLLTETLLTEFHCSDRPVWSQACATESYISSLVNGIVTFGLSNHQDNRADGVAYYLQQQTLSLFSSSSLNQFPAAFRASTGAPWSDSTNANWTTAAAIAYNLAVPDMDLIFPPDPPMRNVGIVILIGTELAVGLLIGLSCFFLSLMLLRRAHERDRNVIDTAADDDYYSAADEESDDGDDMETPIIMNPR